MLPIKPVKIEFSEVATDLSLSPDLQDTADKRKNFDSRLMEESGKTDVYRHYPLMEYFGLSLEERQDEQNNDRLKEVYRWVSRRVPQADAANMSMALRMLERELGMPQWGDTRLNHIYAYAKIENQIDELESIRKEQYGR